MKAIRLIATLFVAALLLAPLTARACPLCAEAIADSNSGDDDADNFPAAMNQSIYLMLAVPYLSFGIVGLMIYRGVKKNDEYRRLQNESDPDDQPPVV